MSLRQLFTLCLLALLPLTSQAAIKTESLFELSKSHLNRESVRVTESRLNGRKAYFLSYSVNDGLIRKTAIPESVYQSLLEDFERTFPPQRQARLAGLSGCNRPFTITTQKAETKAKSRNLCVENATEREKEAVAKWWMRVRELLLL